MKKRYTQEDRRSRCRSEPRRHILDRDHHVLWNSYRVLLRLHLNYMRSSGCITRLQSRVLYFKQAQLGMRPRTVVSWILESVNTRDDFKHLPFDVCEYVQQEPLICACFPSHVVILISPYHSRLSADHRHSTDIRR